MPVAPYESCISCSKGDTSTVLILQGDRDFTTAALIQATGLKAAGAITLVATMHDKNEDEFAEGMDSTHVFRLCRGCAAKTNAPVDDASRLDDPSALVRAYIQREMFPDP